jgi:UDP-N-acetylglucosamine 2-epimerase (non-hydrolysing)
MRDRTERPEGVEGGCSVLAGTNQRRIVSLVSELMNNGAQYNRMTKGTNPYGKGDSSGRIAKILNKEIVVE